MEFQDGLFWLGNGSHLVLGYARNHIIFYKNCNCSMDFEHCGLIRKPRKYLPDFKHINSLRTIYLLTKIVHNEPDCGYRWESVHGFQ